MAKRRERFTAWLNSVRATILILGGLAAFFSLALVGFGMQPLFPLMLQLSPWLILLLGISLLVLVGFQEVHRSSVWPWLGWLGLSILIMFVLETSAFQTGLLPRVYSYQPILGPQLLGIPLILLFNRAILVFGLACLTSRIHTPQLIRALLSALGALAFSLLLDPAASDPRIGFWTWEIEQGRIWYHLAWSLLVFGLSLLYSGRLGQRIKSWLLPGFVLHQLMFFLFLRLTILGV